MNPRGVSFQLDILWRTNRVVMNPRGVSFQLDIVWRTWAPMKASFFAWEASWD